MGTKFIQDSTLTNIASAIRAKTGGTDAFTPAQMVTEIQNIPTGGGTDVEDALVTKTISEYTNPRVSTIGNFAFNRYSNLTTVSFPVCTTIGTNAFYFCTNLTTASFPSCTIIHPNAFQECSMLTTVSFPVCTTINYSAFYECRKLTSLFILASSVCQLNASNAIANTPMANSAYLGYYGSIFVPASLVEAYKSATNWTYYADRITAAPEGI